MNVTLLYTSSIIQPVSFSLRTRLYDSFNDLYIFGVSNLLVLLLTILSFRRSVISDVELDVLGRFLVGIACNLKDFVPVSII